MKIARKNFELIVTVGPAIMKKDFVTRIMNRVFPIFRINGAHGSIEYVENIINDLYSISRDARILIDLPGNKIRTKDILEPIPLKRKEVFSLLHTQINYPNFKKHLKKGNEILANDSNLRFTVEAITEKTIVFKSFSDGYLENNKGLHIAGIHNNIPFLFKNDLELLNLAVRKQVGYIGLSFVRQAQDVEMVKEILKRNSHKMEIVTKIEKLEAIRNLKEILELTNYILIDRGDLSTEVGLIELPYYQDMIIRAAKDKGVNVFVATQILKNMQTKPVPLIAEVGDLYNILRKGVHGIQLSEETAIGNFPEECVFIITEMFKFIKKKFKN